MSIIAGYCRLSKEDGDASEKSNSIKNQQELIIEYVQAKGLTVSEWYIDDGYSGYVLDRPALKRLKNNVANIDVIVAKDLSRIGRNNPRVLLLIEELQEAGKQVVLINDSYDSLTSPEDITIPVKSLVNELYLKDISKKIRSSITSLQKSGKILFGVNFFGYLRHPQSKNKLVVDDRTAHIVQEIFNLYIKGLGYRKICEVLDSKGYVTPSRRIQEILADKGRVFRNKVSIHWQTHMVQRILENPIYTGTLVTHKRCSMKMKGRQLMVSPKDRYYFENSHEAIISTETFRLANEIRKRKLESNHRGKRKNDYLFSSLCFCGECGHSCCGYDLGRGSGKFIPGYNCTAYTKYGRSRCSYIAMSEEILIDYFKEFLKELRQRYSTSLQELFPSSELKSKSSPISKLVKELATSQQELKLLLLQKAKDVSGELSQEELNIMENSYQAIETELINRIKYLQHRIRELQSSSDLRKESGPYSVAFFDNIINSSKPDRWIIELLISRIRIFKDKTVEFQLNIEF